jgi:predicted secreted Zn-dependent protease
VQYTGTVNVALVASLLISAAASAAPTVSERTEEYAVAGTTADEIRINMNRLRPALKNGRRLDAFTDWQVRHEYRHSSTAEQCTLTSFTTTVDVVTTLPRWSGNRADTALAQRWDRYRRALEEHERGHAQIGIRAAEAIQSELSKVPPHATCADLQNVIESRAEAILQGAREEEADYDRRTKHGTAQGAVFP